MLDLELGLGLGLDRFLSLFHMCCLRYVGLAQSCCLDDKRRRGSINAKDKRPTEKRQKGGVKQWVRVGLGLGLGLG